MKLIFLLILFVGSCTKVPTHNPLDHPIMVCTPVRAMVNGEPRQMIVCEPVVEQK